MKWDLVLENWELFASGAWMTLQLTLLSLAIGQGANSQTPVKMAQFYVALARDGSAPPPTLAQGIELGEGWALNLSPEHLASLAELGDRPIGIADRNPGATTTVPHAVTTVGMVSTLALLAIAAALATYRLTRRA